MTTIHIYYGTESGNAEMVADDVAEVLTDQGHEVAIEELCDVDVGSLVGRIVVISSTYGEGELPETAAPFHASLLSERPDLSGLEFAAFGLGDSTYETFANGIDILRSTLIELGARQLGALAKHDASSGALATDLARAWASTLLVAAPAA